MYVDLIGCCIDGAFPLEIEGCFSMQQLFQLRNVSISANKEFCFWIIMIQTPARPYGMKEAVSVLERRDQGQRRDWIIFLLEDGQTRFFNARPKQVTSVPLSPFVIQEGEHGDVRAPYVAPFLSLDV
jgi:hypothetical protein